MLQGAGARPAFPDNRPRIIVAERYIYVNGLYRHGFLLAPVLAELVADYIETGATRSGGVSLQILLNGEPFATDARTLAELCARSALRKRKVATAVNGSFVASAKRELTAARAQGRDRDRGAEAGRLMLDTLRRALQVPSASRNGAISLARQRSATSGRGVVRRDRHRFAPARVGADARPAKASGS